MPRKQESKTHEKDAESGEPKSPSTEAGEFVREEMHHIGEGKGTAQSPKQAVAIGLSKARRAGVKLPVPKKGKTSEATRRKAAQDTRKGQEAAKTGAAKGERKSTKKTPRRKAAAAKSPRGKTPRDKAPRRKAAAAEKPATEKAPRRTPRKKAEPAADATA